jgi:hypothetical protein
MFTVEVHGDPGGDDVDDLAFHAVAHRHAVAVELG